MRRRVVALLALAFAGSLTLSLIRGQDQPAPPAAPKAAEPGKPAPAPAGESQPLALTPARDLSKFTGLPREMLLSAQRGADYLYRMNGVKGRFLHGYLPALKTPMEGDNYLHQAGAAFALARAARVAGEARYAARATQAVLALLDETAADPKDSCVRCTSLPSAAVNRLGAAGLLVLAVHELPGVQPDLLDKAEQLCNYVRRQARPDGSLRCRDGEGAAADDPDEVALYTGPALYGLARSQKLRPAPWKLDLLRKAAAHYGPWWRDHKSLAFVPGHTAAYAEAYLLSKDEAFLAPVTEMNDWLCGLQYAQIDPRRMKWYGGFMGWANGRAVESAPDVTSAACAEGLAQACRVAREKGDLQRHERYGQALVRCLQFLTTLQYTDANTQHFAPWYRSELTGGFYASPQDGNLRIDYTQHALSALLHYLEHVVE